ncbi:DUF420 domain-containing protein [Haladaptatus sp. CMSO5]|uniref:DUF420 domain-containing protein n=1 Tax=Haladaptatus sp. CMSO5 TaxID=3120514 RepID=UPI002FCE38CC
MATASGTSWAKENPRTLTIVLSVVGYALVIGVFAGTIDIFPQISNETVILLSDMIAVINSAALIALLAGWRFIKRGEIRKHRAAMLTSFALILLFLVVYLLKVGGGFEKAFVGPELVKIAYLIMLAVHILLSVVSVPVVIYAVVLGLTHTPDELRKTNHAKIGRIAVAAWTLSLGLGIVTYLLLNHIYAWGPLHRGALFLLPTLGLRRP